MKDKKSTIYKCFVLLVILLSFVIYYGFSDVAKTAIQNVSFAFIIITEIIFFGVIYFVCKQKNRLFLKSGVISVSSIYLLVNLILNIFLKTIFSKVRILIVINVILLIFYIGIILLINLAEKEN